jgi:hypothetical protein
MPRPEANATLPRPDWNPLTLAVLTALWIAAFANWPLWRALSALPEMASPRGALFHRRLRRDGGRRDGGADRDLCLALDAQARSRRCCCSSRRSPRISWAPTAWSSTRR